LSEERASSAPSLTSFGSQQGFLARASPPAIAFLAFPISKTDRELRPLAHADEPVTTTARDRGCRGAAPVISSSSSRGPQRTTTSAPGEPSRGERPPLRRPAWPLRDRGPLGAPCSLRATIACAVASR